MNSIYKNLSILTFGIFSILNTELGIIPILPQLAQLAKVSIGQAGVLITVFALTVTFVGPLINQATHSVNKKLALIIGQSLILLCNLITIMFPYFYIMLFARFLGGVGHPLFFSIALSYPSYSLPLKERSRAVSILFLGVNLAFIIGFPMISFLAITISWKVGFMFSVMMNVIALLLIIFFIPKDINQEKKDPNNSISIKPQFSFKDKGFILSIPILMLTQTGIFIIYSYFSPFLLQVSMLSPYMLTIAVFIFGVFGLIGNIIFTIFPPRRIILNTLVILGIIILCLIGLHFTNIQVYLYTFAVVAIWGALQSILGIVIAVWFSLNKTTNAEAVNSLLVSGFNLGISFGSLLGGMAISRYGIEYLPIISVMVIATSMLLIGIDYYRNKKIRFNA